MKRIGLLILAAMGMVAFVACNNKEGEGGTGTIEGKVMLVLHPDDDYDFSTDTIEAAKQDVFIVYGDDTFYGDDVETGCDGTYRFSYLTRGTYTVYAYSELASGEKLAVMQKVTLNKGETVKAPTLYIHKGKANGTSMIRGWVRANYFNGSGNTISNTWAYEHRVYIQRMGEPYYFDDVRVGSQGSYYFQKLQPDTYVIYTFGEYSTEVPYPVYDTVTVEEAGQIYDADTLVIGLKA